MPKIKEIIPLIQDLVGEKVRGSSEHCEDIILFKDGVGIGYSQFNEILLLLGFDRVGYSFFQFLVDGKTEYQLNSSISTLQHLKEGIDRFLKIALINYGNIMTAFYILSDDKQELEEKIENSQPVDLKFYQLRHKPIKDIEPIPKDKTYYLGYYIQDRIDSTENPLSEELKKEVLDCTETGIKNQLAYLSSDHLDIYIATSMREKHEFVFVNELINDIFSQRNLKELNLRWFDPTQAFCVNRIDKGLSEALMLKRAKCTLYLAQETDTLGKDSELASTLAQGKPVIAYVPVGDKAYVDKMLENLREVNPSVHINEIIIEQLKIFDSKLAWTDPIIQETLTNIRDDDNQELRKILYQKVESHYSNRANALKKLHPLGIQVYLDSGVANGVLVVRNVEDCSNLLRAILTNSMDFYIDRKVEENGEEYFYLKEKISDSIFRLITGDRILTNTFWNFYR